VLSLPHSLRYRLAWDHTLCRAVLRVYTRALLGFERRRGRRRGIGDGRSGTVTAIQRFGYRHSYSASLHCDIVARQSRSQMRSSLSA